MHVHTYYYNDKHGLFRCLYVWTEKTSHLGTRIVIHFINHFVATLMNYISIYLLIVTDGLVCFFRQLFLSPVLACRAGDTACGALIRSDCFQMFKTATRRLLSIVLWLEGLLVTAGLQLAQCVLEETIFHHPMHSV